MDIPDAKALYEWAKANSSIELFFVKESDILSYDNLVPEGLKFIPGTTKIHQMKTLQPGSLQFRCLSCYCTNTAANCDCHEQWKSHNLGESRSRLPELREVGEPEPQVPTTTSAAANRATAPNPKKCHLPVPLQHILVLVLLCLQSILLTENGTLAKSRS